MLLRRLYVLVFIHHDSRRVRFVGVTANPATDWVTQQARNISMELADEAKAVTFLVRDRDTKYTASFDAVFAAEGTRTIKTPVRAPRVNAICERVIGTLRRECVNRPLILGRRRYLAIRPLPAQRGTGGSPRLAGTAVGAARAARGCPSAARCTPRCPW